MIICPMMGKAIFTLPVSLPVQRLWMALQPIHGLSTAISKILLALLLFGRTTGGNASITWNGTTLVFDKALNAPSLSVTNLTNGYLPYHVNDITGLANSPVYTDGAKVGIGTIPASQLHVLSLTEQLRLGYNASNYTSFTVGSDGTLTIAPNNGSIYVNPGGNYVYPVNNYDINLGSLNKKYLTLHAAELWVETLVAQNTMATIGGRILVAPTTELTSDLAAACNDDICQAQ